AVPLDDCDAVSGQRGAIAAVCKPVRWQSAGRAKRALSEITRPGPAHLLLARRAATRQVPDQTAARPPSPRSSRWLIAALSFIGLTGLCSRLWPSSRICCLSSLL